MPILTTLWNLVGNLADLVGQLASLAGHYSLLLLWIVWWLFAVNWRKAWPVLHRGAWVPLVLLMILTALVWSRIAPVQCDFLGFITIPNFWWQLLGVSLLMGLALFCGWLQGKMHLTPPEVNLEPPVHPGHGHDHGHGHSHGH